MRDRKIQRMVHRGEITHTAGQRMAKAKAMKSALAREEPIPVRNSERYSDPTAFHAVLNIVSEQRQAKSHASPRTSVVHYA